MTSEPIKQNDLVRYNQARPKSLFRVVEIKGDKALIRKHSANAFDNWTYLEASLDLLSRA